MSLQNVPLFEWSNGCFQHYRFQTASEKKVPPIRKTLKGRVWFTHLQQIVSPPDEQNWTSISLRNFPASLFSWSPRLTCPDALHTIVLSVESDLKLHVYSLVSSKDSTAIERLESDKTEPNFKPRRAKSEIPDKLCKAVASSFPDAEVIISDCARTIWILLG